MYKEKIYHKNIMSVRGWYKYPIYEKYFVIKAHDFTTPGWLHSTKYQLRIGGVIKLSKTNSSFTTNVSS